MLAFARQVAALANPAVPEAERLAAKQALEQLQDAPECVPVCLDTLGAALNGSLADMTVTFFAAQVTIALTCRVYTTQF